jgi:hypothetical protein
VLASYKRDHLAETALEESIRSLRWPSSSAVILSNIADVAG